jgi:tellurite resistance-related uncharacterized protein
MKRDPILAPLSRDHHHALVLARSLKRDAPAAVTANLPGAPSLLIEHVRERFARELEPHFAIEERDLVPECELNGEPLRSLAQRVLRDHAALRASVAGLTVDETLAERLDAFAHLLEEHVRFEERSWFVALEGAWSRMPRLPDGLHEHRRTATFDPDTTPAGLRRSHDLKAGTWGEIVVVEGRVHYVLEDDGDLTLMLTPERPGVVAPTRPHHVVPRAGSRFFVRFLCQGGLD